MKAGRQYRGKAVAIVFVIATAILFGLVYSINARLQAISGQLRVVRDSWTPVAPLVRDRVEAARLQVQQLDEIRNIEVFRFLYQNFMQSSLYDDQARVLPQLFARAQTFATPKSLRFADLTSKEDAAIDRFLEESRQYETLKNGTLGQLTTRVLQLDYPPSVADEVNTMRGGRRAVVTN